MFEPNLARKADQTKRLNVRLTPAEHKRVRLAALEHDMSCNDFAIAALKLAITQVGKSRKRQPVSA